MLRHIVGLPLLRTQLTKAFPLRLDVFSRSASDTANEETADNKWSRYSFSKNQIRNHYSHLPQQPDPDHVDYLRSTNDFVPSEGSIHYTPDLEFLYQKRAKRAPKSFFGMYDSSTLQWVYDRIPVSLHQSEYVKNTYRNIPEENPKIALPEDTEFNTYLPESDLSKETVEYISPFLPPQAVAKKEPEVLNELDAKIFGKYLPAPPMAPPQPRVANPSGVGFGAGKRKSSLATARVKVGEPEIRINGKLLVDYFRNLEAKSQVLFPLAVTETLSNLIVNAHVRGGGVKSQGEALRQAVAYALQDFDPNYRVVLKKAALLRKDPRVVERKKTGQVKARKKTQWVKR